MYYSYYWPVKYAAQKEQRVKSAPPFQDQHRFLQMTLQAIYNEREAQLFYRALEDRAITPFQKRQIRHAHDDEVKHERKLTNLYKILTGHPPHVRNPSPPEIPDFQVAVRKAFEDELEAAEMYRTMYLMTHLQWVRDLLMELMTDEFEHANRFAFIRAEL
ncbi:hypothetical protein CIG75_05165 [Tumebacillus algifaecis]|uniref:Rubrerythrin diiron-binding domain-containing protein n=1 Tax=Tumebacillus algifaecis TaxID=1214604 RepID=A0A223CZD6_9BACL|nr:ferritin-like domain-containing protein [Tumebacillus algifaecis]ASS74437.1 hypothetical protein CIG75_05165 [Tumebacillus algifaecis]